MFRSVTSTVEDFQLISKDSAISIAWYFPSRVNEDNLLILAERPAAVSLLQLRLLSHQGRGRVLQPRLPDTATSV